jgi:uncharacterized membrane protein
MKRIFNTFIAGLTAILPVYVTILILFKSFDIIDGLLGNLIVHFFHISIPGLGFVVTISGIYFIGLFAKHYFGEAVLNMLESIMAKIPVIQIIYGGVKDISSLLTKNDKSNFTQVVKINFPSPAQVSIGLITNESVHIDGETLVAVFIATTPNPTNGFLVYVKREDLVILDVTVEQAIKMAVSMGSITPPRLNRKTNQASTSHRDGSSPLVTED